MVAFVVVFTGVNLVACGAEETPFGWGTGAKASDKEADSPGIDCQARAEKLDRWAQTFEQISAVGAASKLREAAVILIGERHGSPIQTAYHEFVRSLKTFNENLDCLFLENHWHYADDYQRVIDNGDKVYRPLVDLGLQVHLVDNHWTRAKPFDGEAYIEWVQNGGNPIQARNETMAQEIENLIDAKTCKGGVLIVGSNHSVTGYADSIPVQQLLSKANASILAFDSVCTKGSSRDSRWHFPSCEVNPVAQPVGFKSTDDVKDLSLNDSYGYWGDLDFAFSALTCL